MTVDMSKDWFNTHEVAEIFEVGFRSVHLWLLGKNSLKLNGVKESGVWKISKEEVARYANLKYGRAK